MAKRFGFLMTMALMLALVGALAPVAAQDDEPDFVLPPGELIQGEIVPNGVNVWMAQANEGDILVIELQSDDFDPTISLLAGDLEMEDDDSGLGNDAYLISEPLPASEEIIIGVTAAFGSESGVYWLRYDVLTPQEAGELPQDGLVAGIMGDNNADRWQFEGSAGDVLRIAGSSSNQDLLMRLFYGDDEIAADDDSGGNLNPLFDTIELPEDGTYTLVVEPAVDVDISGSVYLLEILRDADDTLYEADAIGRAVLPASLTFSGMAGDEISLMARGDEIDVVMRVLDAEGNVLAEDDDSGVDFGAAAITLSLPDDGEYTVEVSPFGDEIGLFSWRMTGLGSAAESSD